MSNVAEGNTGPDRVVKDVDLVHHVSKYPAASPISAIHSNGTRNRIFPA